jgi:hypothetical protein
MNEMKWINPFLCVWIFLSVSVVPACGDSGTASNQAAQRADTMPAPSSPEEQDLIQATVLGPVVDGINLAVPPGTGNAKLAAIGLLDVTSSPFHADPTGKKDSTEALQLAINFARNHQMVCYFPAGTYRVSDTLSCTQNPYLRSNGQVWGGRNFPCVLSGSRRGSRPRILLSPHSPGYGNPAKPKYVIHFWARNRRDLKKPQPNIAMNQMLINLDVIIGEGNPGAVAIRSRGAQGCGIEECTIDATHGLTGIEGGLGSGGGLAAVTVIGGRIGLDLRETQPAPTITGASLIRQRDAAILYEGRQSLCAVGIRIVSTAPGPVVKGLSGGNRPSSAQVCLIDSEILFEKPGGIAVGVAKSLYLNNVYVRGASKVVLNPDGSQIQGNEKGWVHVIEYARGVRPDSWRGFQYEAPVYIDGKRSFKDLLRMEVDGNPPPDLVASHLWPEDFPHWESAGAVNVKAPPYLSKGDGQEDDTAAIQRAVDENEIVFLPKGYYCITESIRLKPNTKLVGIGRHLSVMMVRSPVSSFKDPEVPQPLVESSNVSDAETVLAFCGLYVPKTIGGAFSLKWQSGGRSFLRDVNFITQPLQGYKSPGNPQDRNTPFVVVTGNGGGRWYNFFQASHRAQGSEYRHLLVDNTDGPFAVYQCNPEHALGRANMEIRASRHVSIYGLKSEGNRSVLRIVNSDHVRLFGCGGNAAALEGQALFSIRNTPNFLIANAVDTPRLPDKQSPNPGMGRGVDPRKWIMISEELENGQIIRTRPLDRPVLFRRGLPERVVGMSPTEPDRQ